MTKSQSRVKLAGYISNAIALGTIKHPELALTENLNTHAAAASEGLRDLVKRRLDADILRDDGHPYWTWKEAFRQLTMQRMAEVYWEYYK